MSRSATRSARFPDAWRRSPPPEPLPPVNVAPDRVTRVLVGHRPFRPGGPVIRTERLGPERTLVHNYGHGGAGVTLAWGSAHEAVAALRRASSEREVAVIGAGAVGLATACLLVRAGCSVRVYSAALPPETTSNIAGAIWGPAQLYDPSSADPDLVARVDRLVRRSRRIHQRQALTGFAGVRAVRLYYLSHSDTEEARMAGALDTVGEGVAVHDHPPCWPEVRSAAGCWTLMIDPDVYLAELIDRLRTAGVDFIKGRIDGPAEAARLPERAVVQCTGLGARSFAGDDTLIPIRGQLVLLKGQEEIDYAYKTSMSDGEYYMFPRRGEIVLGGTRRAGDASTEPDPAETARLLAGHAALARRLSSH